MPGKDGKLTTAKQWFLLIRSQIRQTLKKKAFEDAGVQIKPQQQQQQQTQTILVQQQQQSVLPTTSGTDQQPTLVVKQEELETVSDAGGYLNKPSDVS